MTQWDAVSSKVIDGPHRLLSSDVFDTILLRDGSTERQRLAEGCRIAAVALQIPVEPLVRLRWMSQEAAYRAVVAEGLRGEASLHRICSSIATLLGLGEGAARTLEQAEIEADMRHLRPSRRMTDLLQQASARGKRVVAVSDTYYSGEAVSRMLAELAGDCGLSRVYSSSDVGLTKHDGDLYGEVARREGVRGETVLHLGDNYAVDVERAREASWGALHVPRHRLHRAFIAAGHVRALSSRVRAGCRPAGGRAEK